MKAIFKFSVTKEIYWFSLKWENDYFFDSRKSFFDILLWHGHAKMRLILENIKMTYNMLNGDEKKAALQLAYKITYSNDYNF